MAYFGPRTRQPWHGRLHVFAGRDPGREAHRASLRLLDLMAVGHYLLETPAPPALVRGLEEVTGSAGRALGDALLFERAEAVPRAYAVRRVHRAPDLRAALRSLEDPEFRPREEAVLIGGADAPGGPAAGAGDPADEVSISSYEAERVVLSAACAARCLLVLPDLHYPGWHARVDGREAPIERTNAIFRGVWLEPGAHEVVFRFAPASFRIGMALFGAALVALAAAGAASLRRRLYARPGRRLYARPAGA